jgi:hypothetical protein
MENPCNIPIELLVHFVVILLVFGQVCVLGFFFFWVLSRRAYDKNFKDEMK